MCGIFGLISTEKINKERASAALDSIKHRGPDGKGEFHDDSVYLGHRRLRIIDLSENGKQPMCNENEQIWLTFNGEIYNFLELKKDLVNKYNFKSTSDSEVLIYGYKEWGIDGLLERIEGMFAFGLYDKQLNKFFIVRDRPGIKPIYYSRIGNEITFGSELKAIQTYYQDLELEYDYTAFYDFMTYQYVPTPKTMYKNIFKLEPGNYLEIDVENLNLENHSYWELKVKESNATEETAKATIRQLIDKAVDEQMISDVPIGFFLSGGIDSSVVVATASKLAKSIETFSIGFDYDLYNETEFAEIVAKKFETNHTVEVLDAKSVQIDFHKMKEWYDEPFADTSAFPTHLVSKLARRKVTVALTGDGGDEVFGGYTRYLDFKKKFGSLKYKLTSKFKSTEEKIDQELDFYISLFAGKTKSQKLEYKKKWNIAEDYDDYWYFRKFYKPELPVITRLQYLDFNTYLHDDILTKVDRASMVVALETRVPLLATYLIEYAFNLPEDLRLKDNNLKGIFKESYKDILPDEIINKGKKGFSIPFGLWKNQIAPGTKSREEAVMKLFEEQTKD